MNFKGKFSNIRKVAGTMNQTETRYAQTLMLRKKAGMIEDFFYEQVKFKVLDGSWYCPDFMVVCKDHIEFHEVKGGYMLDKLGKSKFMQACTAKPYFRWLMISWQGKKDGWVTIHDNKEVSLL